MLKFKFLARRKRRMLIMRLFDVCIKPKKNNVVVICKKQVGFNGNIRLVAEELVAKGFLVSVFWEGEETKIDDLRKVESLKSVDFYNKYSLRAILVIAKASLILLSHSIRDGYISHRKKGRKVINLWHGVPIKGIELAMPALTKERKKLIMDNSVIYDHMIASSHIDRLAMSSCFGVEPNKIWLTGLPRYDLLVKPFCDFSEDIQKQKLNIKNIKNNRKLVLYAPTFREYSKSPVEQVGVEKLNEIAGLLLRNNAVLGIRCHHYDDLEKLSDDVMILTDQLFPETNIVLSETDLLITDFSSVWVDYLLLDKPVLGFALDYESYMNDERGSLYEFLKIFPGEFFTDYDVLIKKIPEYLNHYDLSELKRAKDVFFGDTCLSFTKNVIDKIEQVVN